MYFQDVVAHLQCSAACYSSQREKEGYLTKSYDKSPFNHRKIKKSKVTTQKNANKNFDYTMIAERLRTVSLSNDSHQTGVVKPVYGIPSLPQKLCNQKDTHLKKIVNNPSCENQVPTANQSEEAALTCVITVERHTNAYINYLSMWFIN